MTCSAVRNCQTRHQVAGHLRTEPRCDDNWKKRYKSFEEDITSVGGGGGYWCVVQLSVLLKLGRGGRLGKKLVGGRDGRSFCYRVLISGMATTPGAERLVGASNEGAESEVGEKLYRGPLCKRALSSLVIGSEVDAKGACRSVSRWCTCRSRNRFQVNSRFKTAGQ